MNQVYPPSVYDPALDCPVPPETLGRIAKAEPEALPFLVDGIPEATRARLAVWLYGRSHTHEIGVHVAATCEGASLRRAAGLVGNVLYDLSRRPYVSPSHGMRTAASGQITLGGSRPMPQRAAS